MLADTQAHPASSPPPAAGLSPLSRADAHSPTLTTLPHSQSQPAAPTRPAGGALLPHSSSGSAGGASSSDPAVPEGFTIERGRRGFFGGSSARIVGGDAAVAADPRAPYEP